MEGSFHDNGNIIGQSYDQFSFHDSVFMEIF